MDQEIIELLKQIEKNTWTTKMNTYAIASVLGVIVGLLLYS